MIKIGDKVKLTKDIEGEDYLLSKGDIGEVSNVIDVMGEMVIIFNPDNSERLFGISSKSVIKTK